MPRNKNNNKQTEDSSNPLAAWVRSQSKATSASGSTAKGSWADIDANTMLALVLAVTHCGGAVMFGVDRQGFGLTLNIFINGDKVSKWFHPEQGNGGAFYEFADKLLQALAE